jgi:hypothetical protein
VIGSFSLLEAGIVLVVLLGGTAISWGAMWLYERREDRREQQRGEAAP